MGPAIAALARGVVALNKFGRGVGMVSEVVGEASKQIKLLENVVKGLANTVGGRWYEMNDIAFKTARTMAMSRKEAVKYNQQLINSTKELAAQYGVTAKELADFQQSYAEAVGRNVVLTREQLSHMSALSKITDSATASKLVDEFDKVGVGIARATAYTGRLQERAKALGVSPAKATKMMADNIKLAASYSFRNGVSDIEKMALKASGMRMDMNAIMNATEKFADIEGAISTSANIQMLGGSFAREFSNPMGAMFESMADPAAFQDRILRTIEGKGTYDAKTGAVTFDLVTMRMMREMAKQLGMSAEQLNNSAMASVQNKKVDEELKAKGNFKNWDDAQLEAIRNLSRTNVDVETGKHFVTYLEDGEERTAFIEDLTAEQLDLARYSQETEEGLWRDVQDIKTILERVHGRARKTKSMKEGVEGAKSWWDAQIVNIQDNWMKPISSAWNNITNWLGKQYYAEGDIVEPIHAEFGAMVPGDSYSGDKVHAMVNSGEMILNPMQQKSMFNLISGLAVNGGMMYGANKLGGKLGYGGLGSTMLMANMLGGGDAGIKEYVEAHFLNKFLKNLSPFKKSMEEVGKVTETTTKSTSLFSQNWKELTNTLSKDWNSFARRVSITSRRYFTTGNWGKITRGVGKASSAIKSAAVTSGQFLSKNARVLGEWIGKYTVKPISKGWGKLINTKPIFTARSWASQKSYDANRFYNRTLKPKASEYSKLIKNLFNDGSKAQASKAASRLQTPKIAMTGRHTGVASEVAKETTSVAKAAGKSSKLLSGIGKVGKTLAPTAKFLSKKIPVIGNVLAVGSALSDMSSASSSYDAKIDEIEKSGMSDLDKARAKDRAAKEKNASYGSSIGSAAGMAIGGALGSLAGPIGSIAGMWLGEKAGSFLGKGIGSLFGGGEEKKLKEEQEKIFSQSQSIATGSNDDLLRTVKSIDSKMPGRNSIAAKSIALSPLAPLEMAMSAIKAIPDVGIFKNVIPTKDSDNKSEKSVGAGKTDINLNVSGTIKLEGGNKSVDFDISKLLESQEFKRKLTEMILKEKDVIDNGGKERKEYNMHKS